MLEIYGILLLGLVVYLNTPKFGHLPDKISRYKINRSSHQKHWHFANLHNTPKMTGKGGFWRVMFDFYFGSHPHTKPSQNIPAHKINWSELSIYRHTTFFPYTIPNFLFVITHGMSHCKKSMNSALNLLSNC